MCLFGIELIHQDPEKHEWGSQPSLRPDCSMELYCERGRVESREAVGAPPSPFPVLKSVCDAGQEWKAGACMSLGEWKVCLCGESSFGAWPCPLAAILHLLSFLQMPAAHHKVSLLPYRIW